MTWEQRSGFSGNKYLVQRRDGTVPEWPWLVLGGRDPAAPAAIRAYADECERLGMAEDYVEYLRGLAMEFGAYRKDHGVGDPDGVRHRTDAPAIASILDKS